VDFLSRKTFAPMREALLLHFAREKASDDAKAAKAPRRRWLPVVIGVACLSAAIYLAFRGGLLLAGLTSPELLMILKGLAATFMRVTAALLLSSLWTVPAGVAIGTHPKLARIAQPIAQIAASVPATAVFPVVVMAMVGLTGGLGLASMVLLVLGT